MEQTDLMKTVSDYWPLIVAVSAVIAIKPLRRIVWFLILVAVAAIVFFVLESGVELFGPKLGRPSWGLRP